MASYEVDYTGGGSSLNPGYGDAMGFRAKAGDLGIPTSIQTQNQLQETTNALNQGTKFVELQPIQQETFEQIPKQHYEEVYRLSKLTGSETSLHAPVIEPSGMTNEGWTEAGQNLAERQIFTAVEKGQQLNPQGNTSITIHSTALPGKEEYKDEQGKVRTISMAAVDKSTGKYAGMIGEDEKYRLAELDEATSIEKGKHVYKYQEGKKYKQDLASPEELIESHNTTRWDDKINNLIFYKKNVDELLEKAMSILGENYPETIKKIQEGKELTRQETAGMQTLQKGGAMLQHVDLQFKSMYDEAYKYSKDARPVLDEIREDWVKTLNENGKNPLIQSQLLDNSIQRISEATVGGKAPQVVVPVEEFAMEKSSDTFANVATKAYKKFGEHTPQINIENLPGGMAFAKANDLKNLVDASRNKFSKNLIEKQGMGKSEAERIAQKVIGVTWDVGHSNILKKQGFSSEDVVKEAEAIAKYVKHVHLTDNFGFSDSHLAVGMGNVPVKGIMAELEKKGYKGKMIHEAGAFAAGFKTSPQPYLLEAMDSPLYPAKMGPTWGQISGTAGVYSGGFGTFLPEGNFSMYGGGFSQIPTELGGQRQGSQSRISGNPME